MATGGSPRELPGRSPTAVGAQSAAVSVWPVGRAAHPGGLGSSRRRRRVRVDRTLRRRMIVETVPGEFATAHRRRAATKEQTTIPDGWRPPGAGGRSNGMAYRKGREDSPSRLDRGKPLVWGGAGASAIRTGRGDHPDRGRVVDMDGSPGDRWRRGAVGGRRVDA